MGSDFIFLWVGPKFSDTYICAIFLLIPAFFHLPQEVASTALIVANKVKQQAIAYIAMAVTNISLAFILANYYGALGISISICCAYLIRTIILNIIYYKELKIDIKTFFKECYLGIMPSILLSTLLTIAFSQLPLSGWIGFISKCIFFVCVFSISIWFLALTKEEKKLITSFIPFCDNN